VEIVFKENQISVGAIDNGKWFSPEIGM